MDVEKLMRIAKAAEEDRITLEVAVLAFIVEGAPLWLIREVFPETRKELHAQTV